MAEIASDPAAHFGTDIAAAALVARNPGRQAIAGRSDDDIVRSPRDARAESRWEDIG